VVVDGGVVVKSFGGGDEHASVAAASDTAETGEDTLPLLALREQTTTTTTAAASEVDDECRGEHNSGAGVVAAWNPYSTRDADVPPRHPFLDLPEPLPGRPLPGQLHDRCVGSLIDLSRPARSPARGAS
jgi:hypothetical protein